MQTVAMLIKDKIYFKTARNGHKRIKGLIQQIDCGS